MTVPVLANSVDAGVPSTVRPVLCVRPRPNVTAQRRSKLDSQAARSSRSGPVKASGANGQTVRLTVGTGVEEAETERGAWRKLARLFVGGSTDEGDR